MTSLVPLLGGAYTAKSVIASAQACINLYPEQNPSDSPFPTTHYLRPGLTELAPGLGQAARCAYTATNGQLYECIGSTVYATASDWTRTEIGTIGTIGTGQVSMWDNGLALVIVDGSPGGWAVNLANNAFAPIVGAGAFYGATRVRYLDTFFLFNRPGTDQWYISLSEVTFQMLTGGPIVAATIIAGGSGYVDGSYSGVDFNNSAAHGTGASADITVAGGIVTTVVLDHLGDSYRVGDLLTVPNTSLGGMGSGFSYEITGIGSSAFDPLDIAAKAGAADPISNIAVMHREIWLVGTNRSSEIWYNAGAADFVFQQMPGAFVEHGCVAPQSLATHDLSVFWLERDLQGQCMVLRGNQYQAERISTHAIENEIGGSEVVSDAVGFTYQFEGHVFYHLTFPTADKTWIFDIATSLWHQEGWSDDDGFLHRHRASSVAFAYGKVVCGDYQTGELYQIDQTAWTDAGATIQWSRGFPHMIKDGRRVIYRQFVADVAVGTQSGTPTSQQPQISLRCSDTKGASWGNPITLGIGSAGQYLRQAQAQRLGMARDRVFKVFGTGVEGFALNGAFVDAQPLMT